MTDDILTINLENLKVSEIEDLEEITGQPIDELFADGKPRGKALRAIGFIMRRRDDPSFTIEQAGDLVINLADTNGAGETPTP